ncbi:MAG: hypothetical protein KGN39_12730 [Betaproteobacteria bacterium]|nr:hypothetical protein [Betaproteobacteria bacterium]
MTTMPTPTPKQQKVFAITQIIGGSVAAIALGYSALANMTTPGNETMAYLLGALTLVAMGYAGYHTQRLGKLVAAGKNGA